MYCPYYTDSTQETYFKISVIPLLPIGAVEHQHHIIMARFFQFLRALKTVLAEDDLVSKTFQHEAPRQVPSELAKPII